MPRGSCAGAGGFCLAEMPIKFGEFPTTMRPAAASSVSRLPSKATRRPVTGGRRSGCTSNCGAAAAAKRANRMECAVIIACPVIILLPRLACESIAR